MEKEMEGNIVGVAEPVKNDLVSLLNSEITTKGTEINSTTKFLYNLIKANEGYTERAYSEKREKNFDFSLTEGSIIHQWKNIENISARLLEFDDVSVLLECLIDKDSSIYEEREFPIEDFQDFELEVGKLFKLCFYRRSRQSMMEIKDDHRLIAEDDFPKPNFVEQFAHVKLTK